jgi:hypothetical protein
MTPTAAMQQAPARTTAPRTQDDLARTAYRLTADLAKPNAAIYWTDLLLSAAISLWENPDFRSAFRLFWILAAGLLTKVYFLALAPAAIILVAHLWRVRKLPKPRISILSPPRKARTILSKIASTITSASFLVISTTRETSSMRSALVMFTLLLKKSRSESIA